MGFCGCFEKWLLGHVGFGFEFGVWGQPTTQSLGCGLGRKVHGAWV